MFPTILQDLHDPRQALWKSSQAIYDIYPLSADATRGAYEQGEAESGLDRFLVRAEDLRIPQARHRVILLGIKRDHGLAEPKPMTRAATVSVGEVIRDLPKLRSDLSKGRSEEHTSELQSLMRISYAVFCLQKKTTITTMHHL